MTTEISVKWDARTIATILAGLRYWQGGLQADGNRALSTKAKARAIMIDHFVEVEPLDLGEIDELCEAINLGHVQPATVPAWDAERIRKWSRERETDSYHLTWGLLTEFIGEAGFDQDEYFQVTSPFTRDQVRNQRVWDNARWVTVWWTIGGSEGYYVHVERIWYDRQPNTMREVEHRDLVLLGKFWDWRRAQEAVDAIQYLVNSVW